MPKRKGRARSRQREEYWRRVVAGHPASRLSIRDWSARHEVTEASFYAWRRTLAQRGVLRSTTQKKRRARQDAVQRTLTAI